MNREEKIEIIHHAQSAIAIAMKKARCVTRSDEERAAIIQNAAQIATIGHFFLADLTS